MKVRTKSAWLLLATLVVGVLLGALGASALQNRRTEQIRETRERGGIWRMVEEVIRVEDDAQRAEIRAVVERAEIHFSAQRQICGDSLAASRELMATSLRAVLTPEQQSRLDGWLNRDRGRRRSGGRHDARQGARGDGR